MALASTRLRSAPARSWAAIRRWSRRWRSAKARTPPPAASSPIRCLPTRSPWAARARKTNQTGPANAANASQGSGLPSDRAPKLLYLRPMRAAAVILFLAFAAHAQFKTTSTLVLAATTVTSADGKYVDGLQAADLILYDNNVPQPIQVEEAFNPLSL